MYALGFTIDSWMNALSGLPAAFASAGSLSRFGPICPPDAAAVNVWQPLQPWLLKTARPGSSFPADLPPLRTHFRYAAGFITSTWLRMIAWPRPHSSVQMMGKVPVRFG